ncbi:MAG TPA: NAD(P)H-hydrate dehydratase [Micromonosporaceae bacterium]|nr:NAD(P)H-hydrate dehydratase [Micromonosporaceae bacterium]
MRGAWPAAAVREAEAALMARLPEGALMQRAAAGLARRCALTLPQVYGASVLLLIGSGDNGGDALYAGARLAQRGARVAALLLNPAKTHHSGLEALRTAGGRVVTRVPERVDLVVDGIVGIGGRGGLRPDAATILEALPADATVVAVDVPSGIGVDSGTVTGTVVRADITVTFGCLKPGLVVGPAAAYAGQVELIDIGLGPHLSGDPVVWVPDLADVAGWWRQPRPEDDKYTRGAVGVAAGSPPFTGAAVLSVGGALAGPAGFLRYAGAATEQVRQRWPEAVITERVADAGRVQAWVAGPGLGTDERAVQELRTVLAASVPVCLDADALTLIAQDPPGWLTGRKAPTVLTPHDREFSRIGGERPDHAGRAAAAARLANWLGVVVLLKGDRTVVATPEGETYANPTGSPALATAGTGDVLSGLIGSLLAAGVPAERAAVAGAFAHGLAGRRAARSGPVTAQHVMSELRHVINHLTGTQSLDFATR